LDPSTVASIIRSLPTMIGKSRRSGLPIASSGVRGFTRTVTVVSSRLLYSAIAARRARACSRVEGSVVATISDQRSNCDGPEA
jgi:hypothetical protein